VQQFQELVYITLTLSKPNKLKIKTLFGYKEVEKLFLILCEVSKKEEIEVKSLL
jgi:hypothetical protein